ELPPLLLLQIPGISADTGRARVNVRPTALVDRARRQFRIQRRAQLAHQYDIELAAEVVRQYSAHPHGSARNREHQRIASTEGCQCMCELRRRISARVEKDRHGLYPPVRSTPSTAAGAGTVEKGTRFGSSSADRVSFANSFSAI